MALFWYKALDSSGSEQQGTFQANSIGEVESFLAGRGQHPIVIQPAAGAEDGGAGTGQSGATGSRGGLFGWLSRITIDDRILICRQLSTMLGAGVPILQAMRIMDRQSGKPMLTSLLGEVADSIEAGVSLSDSFARYPRFASPLFINIVRVGEETGTLDASFTYLAELYENEKEVNERIKSATRYPKIVVSAIVAAVLFLMSFVVPKFVSMFSNAGVALPLPTRILIVLSDVVSTHIWLILVLLIGLVVGYRMALRSPGVLLARDRLWLMVPVFGNLSLKIYLSRFSRVFAVLIRSGVNVIRTLELSATALENRMLFTVLEKVTREVQEGVEMHRALQRYPLFPDMIVQMVAIGEQAGQVDTMMIRVAEFYERETDYLIKNLSTLIEPVLLLVMGFMVGFLALAIYLPMWDMMNVMRG